MCSHSKKEGMPMNDDKSTQLLQTSQKLYSIMIPLDHASPNANIVEIKYLNSKTDADFFLEYDTTPHRHAYYEMHLVTSGLQTYQIDDVLYPVENNAMLLIPPGVRHSIPYSTNVIEKFAISFLRDAEESSQWDGSGRRWIPLYPCSFRTTPTFFIPSR